MIQEIGQVTGHRRVAQWESAAFTRPRPQVRALPWTQSLVSAPALAIHGVPVKEQTATSVPSRRFRRPEFFFEIRRPWRNANSHSFFQAIPQLALLDAQQGPYRPTVTVTGGGSRSTIALHFDAPASLNLSQP